MKEKTTTIYVSDDGLEFQTQEECLWWEGVAEKVRKLQHATEIHDLDDCIDEERLPNQILELLLEDWMNSGILDSCLDIKWEVQRHKGEYERTEILEAKVSPKKVQRLKKFTDWLFSD